MTQRHVLLTTDVIGGVWDFTCTLAGGLVAAGDAVTLLALGSPAVHQQSMAEQYGVTLLSAPLKLEWMDDAEADVHATRQLVAEVARDVGADVVHANQFAAACADVGVPIILTVHSDVLSWRRWTLRSIEVPAGWRAYADLARDALSRADAVVAVSRFLAHEVRSLYGTGRTLDVIHNGWWSPSAAATAPRTRRGTLVAGRVWDRAKNIALVGEAAAGLGAGPIYLAGETAHPGGGVADVPTALAALGHLKRSELDTWFDRVTVYISPALYDPFGLLPLQAALHQCALILSDIPSYRELWDGTACFFKSDDAVDLRRVWRAVLDDPRHLTELQKQAARRARTAYSSARMVEAYRTKYAQVDSRIAA